MYSLFSKHTFHSLLLLILISFIISSCKQDDDQTAQPDFFIDNTTDPLPPQSGKVASVEKLISFTPNNLALSASLLGFSEFVPLIKENVTLYKMNYYTSFKGNELLVSALVGVPENTTSETPWLSFHHGTILKKSDAPTIKQKDYIQYALFSSTGYITVIPDLIGYGASENSYHPYYIKESVTATVSDALMATRSVSTDSNWVSSDNLYLIGYSEGGYITMAMQEYLQNYPIGSFKLITSAAGAGGYNLVGVMDTLFSQTVYESPGYLALLLDSYRKYYDLDIQLSDIFQEPYASDIPNLINGENGLGAINSALTNNLNSLLTPGFKNSLETKEDTPILRALKENSTHLWSPEQPLQLFHGTDDKVVPLSDSEFTFALMQEKGSNVSYTPLTGEDHSSGALKMIELVVPYFEKFRK